AAEAFRAGGERAWPATQIAYTEAKNAAQRVQGRVEDADPDIVGWHWAITPYPKRTPDVCDRYDGKTYDQRPRFGPGGVMVPDGPYDGPHPNCGCVVTPEYGRRRRSA